MNGSESDVCIPILPTIYKHTQIPWKWLCVCKQSIPGHFLSSYVAWEQGSHTHHTSTMYLQQWFPLFGVPCEIPASSWKGSYRWCHCSTQRRVQSPLLMTPWPGQWDPLEGGQCCCLIRVRISVLTEIMQLGALRYVWSTKMFTLHHAHWFATVTTGLCSRLVNCVS